MISNRWYIESQAEPKCSYNPYKNSGTIMSVTKYILSKYNPIYLKKYIHVFLSSKVSKHLWNDTICYMYEYVVSYIYKTKKRKGVGIIDILIQLIVDDSYHMQCNDSTCMIYKVVSNTLKSISLS